MAENPAPDQVVSDSTETIESSTDGTQAGAEQEANEQSTAQERTDWRRKQKEDSDLNAHVQSEISKARTRWQRQQLRAQAASVAETSTVPEEARSVLRQVANEQDDLEDGEVHEASWIAAADRIQPQLERLLQLDGDGRATNPYYAALHKKMGASAMDKKYAEDPIGFVNWVDDQILEMRVDEKVKRQTPAVAAAMAQDEAHTRLRNQQQPLGGSNSAGAALTLDRYETMSFQERQKLRKENPRAIDEMIARAAR